MTIVPDIDVGSRMKIRGQVNIAVAVPCRRYELLVVHSTTQPWDERAGVLCNRWGKKSPGRRSVVPQTNSADLCRNRESAPTIGWLTSATTNCQVRGRGSPKSRVNFCESGPLVRREIRLFQHQCQSRNAVWSSYEKRGEVESCQSCGLRSPIAVEFPGCVRNSHGSRHFFALELKRSWYQQMPDWEGPSEGRCSCVDRDCDCSILPIFSSSDCMAVISGPFSFWTW